MGSLFSSKSQEILEIHEMQVKNETLNYKFLLRTSSTSPSKAVFYFIYCGSYICVSVYYYYIFDFEILEHCGLSRFAEIVMFL